MKTIRLAVPVVALLLVSISSAWTAARYTIQDLGPLDGAQSITAYAVNSSGAVVGTAQINSLEKKPFIYRNGRISYIDMPTGIKSMDAVDINDSGKVLLWGMTTTYQRQTFTWEEGKGFTQIGSTDINTTGNGLNNSGQVTGLTERPNYYYGAYITGDTWTYIDGIGNLDTVQGTAINGLGQVAGYEYNGSVGNSVSKPVFWDGTQLHEIDTFGGNWNEARGLNDSGQVVGFSSLATGSTHAFIWQDGATTDLGTLAGISSSDAQAINNLGQVVGWSGNGFLWENGSIKDLNSLIAPGLGWRINEANDINDLGQIVGNGYYQGSYHAYLMTPVPEPSTAAALAFGLISVWGVRLRSRRA